MKHTKKNDKEYAPASAPDGGNHGAVPTAAPHANAAPQSAEQVLESAPLSKEAELENRLLRALADFDNYRRRAVKEREEAGPLARQELVLELLPVLDHLERGLGVAVKSGADKAFVEGFGMACSQLLSVLLKFGIEPVPTLGAAFDPNLHEAVRHVPSEQHTEGAVIEEVRRGFLSGNRLLRPAQVVVSSGPLGAEPSGKEG